MIPLTFLPLIYILTVRYMDAKATSVPSSLLASVRDYGDMVFGPKRWNGRTPLTSSVGGPHVWFYPFEGSIIDDERTHHWLNGSMGNFDFTASNESDFSDIVSYSTNDGNDPIWLHIRCDSYE